MANQNINELQARLVDELNKKNLIKTKEVENALLTVPRHLFLPGVDLEKVYSNTAIPTKWDDKVPISSSSEPAVYAIMLEQLQIKEGMKILEIGAGTGFNAALMAQITGKSGHVITIDIDEDITNSARRNLDSAGYENVTVICKDGATGYEEEAPYDRIIITAGVWDINPEWFNQLKPGGILLVPMVISIHDQATFAFKRVDDHLESISISGCKFMEFRGEYTRPIKQASIGKSGIIMLRSKDIPPINKEKYFSSFNNPRRDISTGIKASYSEYVTSFLPWLEVVEPQFCILNSAVEEKINYLPAPFKYREKTFPLFFGILHKENVALVNCIEDTGEPDRETFTFYVSSYISDDGLANQLIERITEWDNAGRPDIKNAIVKVYFDKSNVVPAKGEYMITKKWVELLFSW